MYTVCPKCALPLAVTAADLRAGQGYVRCGRCANVFNALLRLGDEPALGISDSNDTEPVADIEDKASATMSRPALQEPGPGDPGPSAEEAHPVPPKSTAAAILAELEFRDLDSTNPKIGTAPLRLIPPQPTSHSSPLWLADLLPGSAPADIDIEEEAAEEPASESVNAPYPHTDEDHLADEADDVDDLDDPVGPEEPGELIDMGEVRNGADAHATEDVRDADEAYDFVDETVGKNRGTGTFETIVLEGDTFLQTNETIPEEVLASEIADVSRRIAEAHNAAEFVALMDERFKQEPESDPERTESEAEPVPELAALRGSIAELAPGASLRAEADDPSTWFRAVRSWGDWRLTAGAAGLALLLVLQALNHWRDDLATRAGWFGPMRGLASMFGEPLHPNWDLGNYDVRQLGASAESEDSQTLMVRLRLTNVGERAQALPLIRLTLRDRFGKAVSRGELEPEQYLPAGERGQRMIRRDQRIDTEIRVLDPTRQASSFELDVCVAAAAGGLRCAGDTPTLSASTS